MSNLKSRLAATPDPVPGAVWVPLTKGAWSLIEEIDSVAIVCHPWHVTKSGYAARWSTGEGGRKLIRMHTQILGVSGVDHINRNPLDNRRCNLRTATGTQNQGNRPKNKGNKSGFKGVSWFNSGSHWRARVAGKTIGYFDVLEDAAKAYDVAASAYFGEFAVLNFPKGHS